MSTNDDRSVEALMEGLAESVVDEEFVAECLEDGEDLAREGRRDRSRLLHILAREC